MLHGGESVNPTVDAFADAVKEKDAADTHARSDSTGPLEMSDLEPHEDEHASEKQEDVDSGCGGDDDDVYVFVDEENDDVEEEEENEDELKEQFYRQQQQEQDVNQFLADKLCFLASGDIQQRQQNHTTRHAASTSELDVNELEAQTQQKVESQDASESATHDRKSSHLETAGASTQEEPRQKAHRRRPSNALLPDGILHLWIFQARQVAFRQHFESMYVRHGLHLRCYLAWKREYLSDIYESNRNVGGNMNNPLWRFKDDHERNFIRGHFSIPLGCHSSPASLPANTELIIEVVCGILVVASARVSLLEFFEDRSSRSSAEDDSGDSVNGMTPQWFPLLGENAGLLELLLEFVPADSFEDNGSENEEIPFDYDANACYNDTSNNSNLDETIRLEDAEPEVQDPSEPNAFEKEYQELEQRALTRNTRLEHSELHEKCTDKWKNVKSDDDSASCSVVVSNNGKTTMYIPKQCRPQHEQQRSNEFQMQTGDNETKMIVAHETGSEMKQLELTPSQEVMIDEQVLDLYRFGISCEDADQHGMPQTSSSISHVSKFPYDYLEHASMYSRKASTCATDILHYNELIQELEASLQAAAARENAEGYRSFMSSSNARKAVKADGVLRHAAHTSIPNPMTAAMGMIPTKSAMKKNSSFGVFGGSYHSNNDPFASEKSSIREAPSKGVVLFDMNSIPERHRNGLERCFSEEGSAMKSDQHKERRRSLPINSLTSKTAQPRKASNSRGQNRTFAIEESKDEPDPAFDAMLRRKRRSSLHSLTDLESRSRELSRNNSNRQLEHSEQNRSSSDSSSSRHSNQTSTRSQRRTSTSNSVINLGGAVLGVGKFINVGSVPGVVRYIGPTNFATGTWIGIELCEKKGKNNGTVKGTQYFTCAPDHGVFIRANRLDVTHQ